MKYRGATQASDAMPENALARRALEAITQIEREARQQKLAQLDRLEGARQEIRGRLQDLEAQVELLDEAIAKVSGRKTTAERRPRRNLGDERDRVGRWMEARRGERFGASDLVREFPDLEGVVIAVFLKPMIKAGKIQTAATAGVRRLKYFVS